VKQTYSDAKHTCATHGMRLCSWYEMKTNLCCGTGCNYDLETAWVLRASYGKMPSEYDPNLEEGTQVAVVLATASASAKYHSESWAVDGCSKVGERQLDQHLNKHEIAPVRCCSFHNSCHSQEIGCVKQTYSDAKHTCATHGMRLCSWYEMKTNLCCGTGCNYDLETAWVLRASYGKTPSEYDPNLEEGTLPAKAWTVDGCSKVGDRKLDKEFDVDQVAPVRCCSDSTDSCHSTDVGCLQQTYSDAKHTCAKHGMRLCSWQEMKTNLCCGTGCNFDLDLAWVVKESYGNPHWHSGLEIASETNITTLV